MRTESNFSDIVHSTDVGRDDRYSTERLKFTSLDEVSKEEASNEEASNPTYATRVHPICVDMKLVPLVSRYTMRGMQCLNAM